VGRPLGFQRLFRGGDTRLHIREKRTQCIGIGRKVYLVGGHGSL